MDQDDKKLKKLLSVPVEQPLFLPDINYLRHSSIPSIITIAHQNLSHLDHINAIFCRDEVLLPYVTSSHILGICQYLMLELGEPLEILDTEIHLGNTFIVALQQNYIYEGLLNPSSYPCENLKQFATPRQRFIDKLPLVPKYNLIIHSKPTAENISVLIQLLRPKGFLVINPLCSVDSLPIPNFFGLIALKIKSVPQPISRGVLVYRRFFKKLIPEK